MAAPVRYVSGPLRTRKRVDGREVGPGYPVMLVQVGSSPTLREVVLDEDDLFRLLAATSATLQIMARERAEA